MCGITGFVTNNNFSLEFSLNLLNKMSLKQKHRGPDSSGTFVDPINNLFIAHQRLSIHDLTNAGAQPMISSCGNHILVFNGEIYNYEEIRKKLNSRNNIDWRGSSDTEVLLQCILIYGIEQTVNLIDGMFAFAYYDKIKNNLFLARDPFGEKPLYLYVESQSFAFSSELSAIELFAPKLTLDQQSVSSQLLYSYVPDDKSIYKEVRKVLPGHYIEFALDSRAGFTLYKVTEYWSAYETAIKCINEQKNATLEESIVNIEESLEKSIIQRMDSDVPLGAFLSGGIDSTCVTALMQKNSTKKIKTFSIGFNDRNYNEAEHAKSVANVLGTEHNELYVSAKDIINIIPHIHEIYDEPFSDSSQIPTYIVSKFAREKVTVVLTGDAGDELFGGYNRHILGDRLENVIDRYPLPLRKYLSKVLKILSPNSYDSLSGIIEQISFGKISVKGLGDKTHKFSDVISSTNSLELYKKLITTGGDCLPLNNPYKTIQESIFDNPTLNFSEQMMLQDTIGYMRNDILTKVDRASMANSLETRVPFLSRDVFNTAWQTPFEHKIYKGNGKYPLKTIASKYVPQQIIDRPKSGFGVPIYQWLRDELRDWAEDLLHKNNLEKSGCLDVEFVNHCWEQHLSGKKNMQYILWNILMFQQWYLSK